MTSRLAAADVHTRRSVSIRACLMATIVFAGTVGIAGPAATSVRMQAVPGCPTSDPTRIQVDVAHSNGGSSPTCNYVLKDEKSVNITVGGFAVGVEYGCAADIEKVWAGKPRTGRTVSPTEIRRLETNPNGKYQSFSGAWTSQEKVFLRVGATAIATITAYADTGLYGPRNLAAVATAVVAANQPATGSCAGGTVATTSSSTSTTAVTGGDLRVEASFGTPDAVQDLLDRLPVRVRVAVGKDGVEGARVTALREGQLVADGVTGANGEVVLEYRVPNPRGRVTVSLRIGAAKAGFGSGQTTVTGTFPYNMLGTVIVAEPVTGTYPRGALVAISGTVHSAFGGLTFPRGVVAKILATTFDGTYAANSDEAGRFRVEVPASGVVTLTAVPFDGDRYQQSSATVDVSTLTEGTLEVNAAPAQPWYEPDAVPVVVGTVTLNGKPAPAILTVRYSGAKAGIAGLTVNTDASGAFTFVLPSLTALPNAVLNGNVMLNISATAIGALPGSQLFMIPVRNRFDDCEPGTVTLVAGAATIYPTKGEPGPVNKSTPLQTFASNGTPGYRFTDSSEVTAGKGRVVLGFPLAGDGAVAGVTMRPGSSMRVLRYCRDGAGRVTLVLEVQDRNAVRVAVDSPTGSNDWKVTVVTPAATVANIRTDYTVAVDGDVTTISLLDGAVELVPTVGKQAMRLDARRVATVRVGSPDVIARELPAEVTPELDDPAPIVESATLPGWGSLSLGEPAAVERFTVQAGVRRVRRGEAVLIPVLMLKAERVANINYELSYDPSVARLDDGDRPVRAGSFLEGTLFQANPNIRGVVKVGLAGRVGHTGTGTITWLRFIAQGAPGTSTALRLTVTTVNAEDGTVLPVDLIHGRIEIIRPEDALAGDCDGSGRLDEGDALCALQVSVQLRPETSGLDVDGNPGVTSRDAAVILQRAIGK